MIYHQFRSPGDGFYGVNVPANEPMDFSVEVNQKIELINDIFRSINVPLLFDNDYLIVDQDYSSFHGARFAAAPAGRNYLPIDFYLESDAIRIDVCKIPESFEWSNQMINDDPQSVRDVFIGLLTGISVIEYFGSPHNNSRLYIFDTGGTLIAKFVLRSWFTFHSTWNYERQLFLPAYPQEPLFANASKS